MIIIMVMLTILYQLGSGLYYLLNDKGNSTRVVKALTWRIAISVCLFLLLMAGFALGIIKPHGIINQPTHQEQAQPAHTTV
jgi:hypothetical protein